MQINGVGSNQIGNSYQNPNRMPNSTTSKKEEEDINQRLEALGVKVELSFRQPTGQEQEPIKETTEAESGQETFSILNWVKKIWDAGIAWLKSVWNDEAAKEESLIEEMQSADGMEAMNPENSDLAEGEVLESRAELVEEFPLEKETDYSSVRVKTEEHRPETAEDEEMIAINADKYRRVGTALHTSGMQDSYNRYGQHSKLGVESSANMTMRK